MARKITPVIEKEILRKAADGESSRAIAAWLLASRGLKITHQAIAKVLRGTRQERGEVAKAVVRERLTKTVVSDLDGLDAERECAMRERERLGKVAARLHKEAIALFDSLESVDADQKSAATIAVMKAAESALKATEAMLKASDRVVKVIDTRLHFSGADESPSDPTEATPAAARSLVRTKFRDVEPASGAE